MNKVFENTKMQIKNTIEVLKRHDLLLSINPSCEIEDALYQRISWRNHKGGRAVSSKAFITINQYFAILTSNAYQLLLFDYSILRYSFVFSDSRLITQNLLWWPCPVKMDSELENEYGLTEAIKLLLTDKDSSEYLRMRTPLRVDFDSSNNSFNHPQAHIHMQHHECRMNTSKPICFNCFIKFIFAHCYPDVLVDMKSLGCLTYHYKGMHDKIEYSNNIKLII